MNNRLIKFFSGIVAAANVAAFLFTPYSAMAATTTCSPDPNVEVSTVDGRISNSDADWATTLNAATGINANDSATIMNVGTHNTGGTYYNYRAFVLVDCSAIPDTDEICSATLTLVSDVTRSVVGSQNYVQIVGASNPASNTALIVQDYDMAGGTRMSDQVSLASWSSTTSKVFTLNASGLANISKTGISKFGIRGGYDLDNVTIANETENVIDIRSADYAGTGSDPVLSVTSAASCSSGAPIIIFVTWAIRPEDMHA